MRCAWCRSHPPGFDAAVAAGPYLGPLRAACLGLKRPRGAWLADVLAGELLSRRGDDLRAAGCEVIVPVPLHWAKLWDRKFNQAELLAVCLGRGLRLKVRPALRRVQRTPALAGLGRVERAEALAQAFAMRGRGVSSVLGRSVLLVDDILTTGATASSASRALKAAGATRVVLAVVARTPEPPR
jgi:ComF family protein